MTEWIKQKDVTDLFTDYPCKIQDVISHLTFLKNKGHDYLYFDGNNASISVYSLKNEKIDVPEQAKEAFKILIGLKND